jgi:hypothetical protein
LHGSVHLGEVVFGTNRSNFGLASKYGYAGLSGDELGYGRTEMTSEQVAVAAECLDLDPAVATSRAYDMTDGVIRVSSDIRGAGSVLVGPDLSVLFFASFISPEQAMEVWRTGRRTPIEEFKRVNERNRQNRAKLDRGVTVKRGIQGEIRGHVLLQI